MKRRVLAAGMAALASVGCEGPVTTAPEPSPGLAYGPEITAMSDEQLDRACMVYELGPSTGRMSLLSDQEVVDNTCRASLLATEAVSRDKEFLAKTCVNGAGVMVAEYASRFPHSDVSSLAGRC